MLFFLCSSSFFTGSYPLRTVTSLESIQISIRAYHCDRESIVVLPYLGMSASVMAVLLLQHCNSSSDPAMRRFEFGPFFCSKCVPLVRENNVKGLSYGTNLAVSTVRSQNASVQCTVDYVRYIHCFIHFILNVCIRTYLP